MNVDLRGSDDWAPARIRPHIDPSPGSPVVVAEVSIAVPLPDDLSWRKFDSALAQRVGRDGLFAWTATEAGRSHCAMLGIDPAMASRYTVHFGAVIPRPSPAVDICMLDTQAGVDLVIVLVEDILLEHMLLSLALADWHDRGASVGAVPPVIPRGAARPISVVATVRGRSSASFLNGRRIESVITVCETRSPEGSG